MAKRACKGKTKAGKACRAAPLRDGDYCSAHDPISPDSTRFGSPEQAAAAARFAGRPRTPRPTDLMREIVEDEVVAVLAPFFRAIGIDIEVVDGELVKQPCTRPSRYVWAGPDDPAVHMEDLGAQIAAAEKLLDRVYGKPRQALEHTGAGGGPIEVSEAMDLSRLSDEQLEDLQGLVTRATAADGL
jgi:hypothetical protein